MDLPEFLLARIAEDEAKAQAAAIEGSHWEAGSYGEVWSDDPEADPAFPVVYAEGRPLPEQATHIAAWDPAHVLAWCTALRAVVERHVTCERENAMYSADFDAYEAWCTEVGADGEDPEAAEAFRRAHPKPPPRTTTPFETDGLRFAVRALAQSFADHPDFDPAWQAERASP